MKVSADVCPLCEGTGWKSVSIGSDRRVTRCDCRRQARTQTLLAAARIPKRYEHCELSNFDFDGAHRQLFPARHGGLQICGGVSVGRHRSDADRRALGSARPTLRSASSRNWFSARAIACLFYDYRELLKQIQNSYNDSVKVTELDVLRPVFEAEVLVLDELGAVKPTEWVWDTVSLILNTRYNAKRTTIITTNLPNLGERERHRNASLRSLEAAKYSAEKETLGDRIGERMLSRLHEMCRIIEMDGEDYRRSVKSASFR